MNDKSTLAPVWGVENSKLPLFRKGDLQLTATEFVAHVNAVVRENAKLREFVESIAKQKPEKPDHWSPCGQCDGNIDDAKDLLGPP